MGDSVVLLGRDVHYYVGTTPTLIVPPSVSDQGIIKTVRGGPGIHQDYSQDQIPVVAWKNLHMFGDVNNCRVKIGSMAPQTFAAGAVTPATDNISLTAHGLLTGDGPYHITSTVDVPAGINVAATGVLTLSANASDLETVTIDSKVYTFDDTILDNIDGHVLIGAAATDSIDNLIAAITLGAGSGSTYAAATTLHPTVTAAVGAGDTMGATAKNEGAPGNAIATTETITGDWDDATLTGGSDDEAYIIKVDANNFKLATSRANAIDSTAINLTDAGTGTHTIDGSYNMVAAPTASIQDGSGGILLKAGAQLTIPAPRLLTLVGMDSSTVVAYLWSS